jgi:hypothetical protein
MTTRSMVTARQATMMAMVRRVTTTTDDNDGDGDGERLKSPLEWKSMRKRGEVNKGKQAGGKRRNPD